MSNSLPVLGSLPPPQSKPNTKFIKGSSTLPISMPTNLNTLYENETAMSSSTNPHQTNSNENSSANSNNLFSCSEVPVIFRPQLPCLAPSKNGNGSNSNKAQLARQVTNVIKRYNMEARQQITDKII